MKYKLINQPNNNLSAVQQILYNRGIKDIKHYLNLSDKDINSYLLLGEENLRKGLQLILKAINNNQNAIIIVDVDCDGYTSAALLINYLYKQFPFWVKNHLDWYMHTSKQHGLNDCYDLILIKRKYSLVICPDSSSNDYDKHKLLKNNGIDVLVLDHHLADHVSENAVIINNQLSDYPNKDLSGVGVVWQFCRYIDNILGTNEADNFLDLVALGLQGDMMSLHSFETRYLISKGFKKENIKNPFIEYMVDKNSFPLTKSDYISAYPEENACTPMGAAFFIVPFVNAITRSGFQNEKYLVFDSMLDFRAFDKILSNKRGHRLGQKESLVLQAIRTVTNVKNRQTRAEEAGMQLLESMIKSYNLINQHNFLCFLLKPGQIDPNIRGLVANKMMAKYQRPCCVLTYNELNNSYDGSARGYTKTGLDSFKDIVQDFPSINYAEGHHNAFGCSVQAQQIKEFITFVDERLKDFSGQIIYRVDYVFKENQNNNQKILQVAAMNDFWGQDVDRSYININFKITDSNFQVMKGNTLKFKLPNGLNIIKFGGTEDQIDRFTTSGYLELNAICKCNANQWNGETYPQLIMEDYEIIDSAKYYF